MTRCLRFTATAACVSLLVLFSSVALAQPYPSTGDNYGPAQYRIASGQNSLVANSAWDVRPLPATEMAQHPTYVASALLGGGRSLGEHPSLMSETCDGCRKHDCECPPRWIISADLLWMSRSRVNPQTMIESPTGESFNARELMLDARAGYRMSWGFDMLDGRAVELRAFSIFDQRAAADVADTNMFFTFHNLAAAIPTNAYTINYVSNLHNGELNWWLAEQWGIRPMIGARWIRVREEFSILDTTNTSWNAFSEMRNDLIGAQIGFKTRLFNGGNWFRLEAAMKSGVYGNIVDYQADVLDATGTSQGTLSQSPTATSFAGELTISAVVQFCPNLAMRFGYQGLWMSEVALAPDQADQSDITTGVGSNRFGALNYQGGFFGLEANW